MNGPNGPHTTPPPEGGSGVLGAALNALRQPPGLSGSSINPGQLSLFLQQLLADGDGNEAPVLGRSQRRALVATAVERVGPEGFSRAFVDALGNLRINKSLPAFLADLGPNALPSAEVVRALFARFGVTDSSPPDERSVAHLFAGLLLVPQDDLGSEGVTNWTALVRGLSTLRQPISWPRAVRSMDDLEGFKLPPGTRMEGLAAALLAAPHEASTSPAVAGLWGPWTHKSLQTSILAGLLALDADTFSFSALPGRRIVTSQDVAQASATVRQLAAAAEGSTWNSLDLTETLILLSSEEQPEIRHGVTQLLERFVKESPELLLISLLQIPEPWTGIHVELAQRLLGMFFASAPGHQLVFYIAYQTNRNFILQALVRSYLANPGHITRIVDIAQDLKALPELLEVRAEPQKPFAFALEVAALASRREVLNADLWIDRMILEHRATFMRATLDFLGEKLREELALQEQDPSQQQPQNFVAPSVQVVATFLRRMRSHGESMSAEDIEAFKMVRNLALQLHPRLLPIRTSSSQEPLMEVAQFAPEMHDECDETFGRMYKQDLSVEDVVRILQQLKASEAPRDNELFACMVHTLFDEQRWIRSYPPTELKLTAHLFGDLIQHSLIDYVPLGIAIRGCLDALRSPPGSPMFEFGLESLTRFQSRLQEWPQLAQALQALPPNQEIAAVLERAAQSEVGQRAIESGTLVTNKVAGAEEAETARQHFTAIKPGPIPDGGSEEQTEPNEAVSDKVLFAINNLSPSNLDSKLAEIKGVLTPSIYAWFAHYLTLERCQLEPNFHGLYLRFLEAVADANLDAHVLRETLALSQRLINSEAAFTTLHSRKALQNVGSWLGLITLARDKPIRFKNFDFKTLLLEGYDSGRLIVAVPFVAKVLEQCAKSRVFKLPNPWLNAVLRVLAELYQLPELKLNLRFEIEVLCKSLGVDLKDIQPSSIIRSRELMPPQAAHGPGVQQQQQAIAGVPTGEMERLGLANIAAQSVQDQQRRSGSGPGQLPGAPQQQQAGSQPGAGIAPGVPPSAVSAAAANAYAESLANMLQNLPHYVQINPQLTLFQNSQYKRFVHAAIDRAIREIIAPVVERSVTIASISTRELVTKDFAMEGDELKMREAAHQMAANLAGSLALVTCKEPLRMSMVNHAKALFLQGGFNEQTLPEQALAGIMQDNLELACSVIEKAAMDKAMPEVDEGLAPAYGARRDHRQRSRGFFWDAGALTLSQYVSSLPDGLRLQPEGLQSQQLRVYQDFGNFTRTHTPGDPEEERAPTGNLAGAPTSVAALSLGPAHEYAIDGSQGVMLTAQQSMEKFGQCVLEIERLLSQAGPDESITSLPQGHELRDVVRQVPVIASQSGNRDEAAMAFSQKVVQLLFKSQTALARDVYVILLERLCEVSLKVAREVTDWLVYAEDERKFNVPVSVSLIRAGLMNITQTDVQLAKFIVRDWKPSMIDFAAKLALECLREPAVATRGQLANVTEALDRAVQQDKATPAATQFIEELKGGGLSKSKADLANSGLREQLAFCFAEWVRLYQHSPNAEKSFIDFVTQLQSQGILKGEEISSMFFRVCTEVGVDSYIKQKAAGGSLATGIFSPVDAFSKMIVLMIKYHADPSGANHEQAKVHYLTKILSIVVLVLAQSHEELGPHFQQKPFFRLFSTLLHDLQSVEGSLQTTYFQTLLAISNTLNTLQPSFFPSFTFSWMSLMSHRLFMSKLLSNRQHGWPAFHRLFCSLLRFLAPFLRNAELQETSRSLYRGTLRIFLVLLHDFPEFLAAYHHSLCDLVPESCIQMRNLVLSAFPRDRRLPDPFAQNLKMDQLPEIQNAPLLLSDYSAALSQGGQGFKQALEAFLQTRPSGSPFLGSLKTALLLPGAAEVEQPSFEPRYNIPLINSLVMTSAVSSLEKASNLLTGSEADATLDILQACMKDLDPEGRFYILTACANQLRFPSSHSAYFSYAILFLLAKTDSEEVKGQILRVLLERVIVNRPHPWGVLCTTFEMLRNRRYVLPAGIPMEIERLLDHIRAGLGNSSNGGAALQGGEAGADGAAASPAGQQPQTPGVAQQ
ncbi:Not1-domain-containing protein [Microstroma glucosiphilum]|uniref:General negative regulator of transcription subunit 1 n=1 Tax=Pseudomicrostroma glucosiphilum TaxID=1684307 RepID=A0A316U7A7_9BASI|nr:Not1-domain-containing protein [Pseudomicrostroma glucosiphilum]PWN20718.1 Not1-domain-containing protein [Pseudomicrostroma glucosiphilum]